MVLQIHVPLPGIRSKAFYIKIPFDMRSLLQAYPFRLLSCMIIVTCVSVQTPMGAQENTTAKELNIKAMQLQSAGKLQDAADTYRKAIVLNPNGPAYHNNLALTLKDLDQLDAAEKEERIALKLKPKKPDYHYNLGLILEKENKAGLAEAEFRQASAANALDGEFHYRLARVLRQQGKLDEAQSEAKQALMLKPNEAAYHQVLGDILLQSKREDEALGEYKTAAETGGPTISAEVKSKIDYLQQVLKTR